MNISEFSHFWKRDENSESASLMNRPQMLLFQLQRLNSNKEHFKALEVKFFLKALRVSSRSTQKTDKNIL